MLHVEAVKGHKGRRRIEEVEGCPLPKEGGQTVGHGVAGEGAGGHDDLPRRQLYRLPLHNGDGRVAPNLLRHIGRKALPVHSQCAAGGHPGGVRRLHNKASQPAQLLLQKAHRVLQPRPPQGVGADQLRELFTFMGWGHFVGLHLLQHHADAPLRQLPRGLAAGQPRSDYRYLLHSAPSLSYLAAPH